MTKNYFKIFTCCVLLVNFAIMRAQSPVDDEIAEILQQKLDECVVEFDVPGLSATILLADNSYWNGAAGVSHIYTQEPMDTSLLFYEASITKMFVATIIFQMIEEGLLGLDDEVGAYLDPVLTIPSDTKIRYLLNHRSGLFDFIAGNPSASETWFSDPDYIWSPRSAIETYGSNPIFNQGNAFSYSNTNYIVLGMIVEEISGNSFAQELKNRILIPYGLNQTFLPHIDQIDGPLATFWTSFSSMSGPYTTDASVIYNDCSLSMIFTAGALVSYPQDVAKFNRLLFSGQIINEASLNQMKTCTNVNFSDGANGYGYGTMRYSIDGKTYFGHSGDFSGVTQMSVHQQEEDITLALSINRNNAPRVAIAAELLATLEKALRINESEEISFRVYPNPAMNEVHLEFDKLCKDCGIELYNETGQRVHSESLKNFTGKYKFDIRKHKKGIYILKITDGKKTETMKIVINN